MAKNGNLIHCMCPALPDTWAVLGMSKRGPDDTWILTKERMLLPVLAWATRRHRCEDENGETMWQDAVEPVLLSGEGPVPGSDLGLLSSADSKWYVDSYRLGAWRTDDPEDGCTPPEKKEPKHEHSEA